MRNSSTATYDVDGQAADGREEGLDVVAREQLRQRTSGLLEQVTAALRRDVVSRCSIRTCEGIERRWERKGAKLTAKCPRQHLQAQPKSAKSSGFTCLANWISRSPNLRATSGRFQTGSMAALDTLSSTPASNATCSTCLLATRRRRVPSWPLPTRAVLVDPVGRSAHDDLAVDLERAGAHHIVKVVELDVGAGHRDGRAHVDAGVEVRLERRRHEVTVRVERANLGRVVPSRVVRDRERRLRVGVVCRGAQDESVLKSRTSRTWSSG